MANKKDLFDDDQLWRQNEPCLSHTLDEGLDPHSIGEAPIGRTKKAKSKHGPWYKHPELIKGVVAGVVVLVVLLVVLIWQFDLFGGPKKPKQQAAAPQPTTQAQPEPTPQSQPEPTPNPQSGLSFSTVPQPGTPLPAVPPGEAQPVPPGQNPQQPTTEQPTEEKKPPLPDDVSKWKEDDYYRARRENNPKLLEAVAYLGKTFVGRKSTARGLTKLLKPLPPEKPAEQPAPGVAQPGAPGVAQPALPGVGPLGPEGPMTPGINPYSSPSNSGSLPGLVEAIVTALGNNGSDLARNTLEEILSGAFKTDDDRVAVEAALKALLAHPNEENDALLLRALTAPDVLRPEERQGPWPAKELQAKAFELTKQSASGGLRTKLAEALVEHAVRLDAKDPMHEFLLSANPLNCGAQLTLYEKANPSEELKTRLEDQFLEYSSLAMARYLGIPDNLEQSPTGANVPNLQMEHPQGGLLGGFDVPGDRLPGQKPNPGAPSGPLTIPGDKAAAPTDKPAEDADMAKRIAAGLWSQSFLTLLEPKLSTHAVETLEKKSKLVLLAGAIPQDSTRALLYKLLYKRRDQGPQALETAGLTEKVITDPGLLTVVKILPRRWAPTGRGAMGRPSSVPTGGNKRVEEARKKEQTEQEWMDLSSKLVRAWCKRFYAATQARQKAEAGSETASAPPQQKLPEGFELSPNARVTATYHFAWPNEAPPEIAKLTPGLLEVYYVRVEEVNKPRTAKAYYSRQAKLRSSDARTIDKITWLDNVRIGGPQKDHRRSLDVLITPPENYTPPDNPRNEDETDLIIEILSVEIKDPSKA